MELSDVVKYFATEEFADAFNSSIVFNGKVNPFAEVTNSGSSSQRRVLETPTSEVIPVQRVIVGPTGNKYIVADSNVDYWRNEALRLKYPILPVDEMGMVGSVGEALATAYADSEVYAYPFFVRREMDDAERSDYLSGFEVYFSKVKNFGRGQIVAIGSKHYRLKTDTWIDGAGFSVAQAVELESPFQTLDVSTKDSTYDSVTDSFPTSATVSVSVFVEHLRQNYEFVSPAFEEIEPGDKAISVLKSDASVKAGDVVGDYKILSVRDLGTWVTCHCRNQAEQYVPPAIPGGDTLVDSNGDTLIDNNSQRLTSDG